MQEFLRGNCTCDSPGIHNASSSGVEAAFENANFCTAWNCEETRFTQVDIVTLTNRYLVGYKAKGQKENLAAHSSLAASS